MSSITGAKAIGLAQREGAVVERPHARVFRVEGSAPGVAYTVVLHARPLEHPAGPHVCTCKAGESGRDCSHRMAASLVVGREVRERQAASS